MLLPNFVNKTSFRAKADFETNLKLRSIGILDSKVEKNNSYRVGLIYSPVSPTCNTFFSSLLLNSFLYNVKQGKS